MHAPSAPVAAIAGTAAPVDTRKAPRRQLQFKCFGCLKEDLDRLDAAHRAGTLTTTGNWSAGEILDHCAILLEAGLDGSAMKMPLAARALGRLFKPMLLKPNSMRPGFTLPKRAKSMLPRSGVTYEQGMARMRRALARIDAGERMEKPSPWLGPLTHEQWTRLNLNHTQLHLAFAKP